MDQQRASRSRAALTAPSRPRRGLTVVAAAVACLFAAAPALALPKLQHIGIPGIDFQFDDEYCGAPAPAHPDSFRFPNPGRWHHAGAGRVRSLAARNLQLR